MGNEENNQVENEVVNDMNNVTMDLPQKPLSVAKVEFVSDIIKLINQSRLPPFVLEYIFKDVYSEVKVAAQRQYEQEQAHYEQLMSAFKQQ